MTGPLNIPELKRIIVGMLDLKSIGSMIQVDWEHLSIGYQYVCLQGVDYLFGPYKKGQESQKIHVHGKNFCIRLLQ